MKRTIKPPPNNGLALEIAIDDGFLAVTALFDMPQSIWDRVCAFLFGWNVTVSWYGTKFDLAKIMDKEVG